MERTTEADLCPIAQMECALDQKRLVATSLTWQVPMDGIGSN